MAYRSRTFPGELNITANATLNLDGTAVTTTGAELNLLDEDVIPLIPFYATTGWNAVTRLAYGTWASTGATAGTYGLTGLVPAAGNLMPANVLVTGCWYEVDVTLTSATDAATIALSLNGVDIIGATAISGGSNIWDAGTHGVTLAAPVACPTAGNVILTTAVETMTSASTIKFFIEYVVTT
mgnify:FL=1